MIIKSLPHNLLPVLKGSFVYGRSEGSVRLLVLAGGDVCNHKRNNIHIRNIVTLESSTPHPPPLPASILQIT